MALVDDLARDRLVGDPIDIVALAARANAGASSARIGAVVLDEWLVSSGLAVRGEDGWLRLTREAWSLAGRAFG